MDLIKKQLFDDMLDYITSSVTSPYFGFTKTKVVYMLVEFLNFCDSSEEISKVTEFLENL